MWEIISTPEPKLGFTFKLGDKSGASLTIGEFALNVYEGWFECGSFWCSCVYLNASADEDADEDDTDGNECIHLLELTNVNIININDAILVDLINERHFLNKIIIFLGDGVNGKFYNLYNIDTFYLLYKKTFTTKTLKQLLRVVDDFKLFFLCQKETVKNSTKNFSWKLLPHNY